MITVSHLTKAYGEQVLFDDAGFALGAGERLGLVGRNGHGKTTLFRLLLGEEALDAGSIVAPKDYRIGHLAQRLAFTAPTVLDEVLAVLGERRSEEGHRAEAALMGLGFAREDLARPAASFSGGFQIRVNLARVLVDQPNLLLLDEPTNYLDIVATRWLERFLVRWPHELIVITHDRRFLQRVTTHSMVIHRRKLRRMAGPVEKLAAQIATEEEVHEKARRNEARKRRQDERFIERFRAKASKASVVKSRMRALERRGTPEALETQADLSFRFNAAPFQAATLLRVQGLGFAWPGGPTLLDDLALELAPGDRVAVIGPNGRGKSTLLNLLADELRPSRGSIRAHPATSIAFFGQTNIDRLDPGRTIEEEIGAAAPDQGRGAVASLCGLLMFPGDAARKPVSVLSGGERSRVLLGKLLVAPANLLLLDEPTSHLDMESVGALLDAVDDFPGAAVLVTHDEAILEQVATRLVVFDGGRVFLFEGGYRDFLDRIGWAAEAEAGVPASQSGPGAPADGGAGAPPRRSAKELRRRKAEIVTERGKVTGPLRRAVSALEDRIHRLETEVADHDRDMAAAAAEGRTDDFARLAAAAKEKRQAIDDDFHRLEQAADELDRARAGFDARLDALG